MSKRICTACLGAKASEDVAKVLSLITEAHIGDLYRQYKIDCHVASSTSSRPGGYTFGGDTKRMPQQSQLIRLSSFIKWRLK